MYYSCLKKALVVAFYTVLMLARIVKSITIYICIVAFILWDL